MKELQINDTHPLFERTGMNYQVFPSDFRQIRYFTLLIIQRSRTRSDERLLLEQQASEVIKNAIKHGNNCDTSKHIHVWYKFSESESKMIVQDEGAGFQEIEKWNLFHRKRQEYIKKADWTALASYASWKTTKSDISDGGNSLFAAVEYWDLGVVYTSARNTIAVGKRMNDTLLVTGEEE